MLIPAAVLSPARCGLDEDEHVPVAELLGGPRRATRRAVRPDHALPRHAQTATEVPQRGPGKPDRRAVVSMFTVGG